jgi:hypothetical protein
MNSRGNVLYYPMIFVPSFALTLCPAIWGVLLARSWTGIVSSAFVAQDGGETGAFKVYDDKKMIAI